MTLEPNAWTMSPEQKAWIDCASYEELLRRWRHSPVGDIIFSGEAGEYYRRRMAGMRETPGGQEEHVRASKAIGW